MVKRIMTVDDSATMRTMLNLTLTHAGYEVVEARDGDEALAIKFTLPSVETTF